MDEKPFLIKAVKFVAIFALVVIVNVSALSILKHIRPPQSASPAFYDIALLMLNIAVGPIAIRQRLWPVSCGLAVSTLCLFLRLGSAA